MTEGNGMATNKPEGNRSVYAALFETKTSGPGSQSGRFTSSSVADSSSRNVSLLLPTRTAGQSKAGTARSNVERDQTTATTAPPRLISHGAHLDFSEALHSMGRNETFLVDPEPLVKRYVTLSADFEKRLRDVAADSPVGAGEIHDLANFFRNEKFTWKLVLALLTAGQGNDFVMDLEDTATLRLPASDAEEIDELFDTSFAFRKTQTLVDWLEHRYGEEKRVSNTASLHAYKEHSFMYDGTRRAILANRAHDGIVTELDPDAPIRQQRLLHEQDIEDGQRLYRCVFELVRVGKLIEADKLAMDQGHYMLAAGMQGCRAFRGNIRDKAGNLLPDEGNPYRDVWKTVVWKKLMDDRVTPAEKAIYASLTGCLEALLPLCADWEDHLWAHLKVMVDVAIELHLRSSRGIEVGRLPAHYPKEIESLDRVLENLENHPELNASEFFRQLHKFLMLQDAEGLLKMMFETCVKIAEEDNRSTQRPSHQLRLMANVALFLRYDRQKTNNNSKALHDPVNNIVVFYVNRLIQEGVYDVISEYVLHLPELLRERSYLSLFRTLRTPTETQQRAIIEAALREEIDIYGYLTKFVYETIHEDGQSATNCNTNDIDEVDVQRINALKWLFAQRGLQLLSLQYINTALRSAVLGRRLQVARKLVSLVPADGVRELALRIADRSQGIHFDQGDTPPARRIRARLQPSRGLFSIYSSDEMSDLDDESERSASDQVDSITFKNALKEYYCFQVYIEAQQSFTEWFEHFHRNKPQLADIATAAVSEAGRLLTAEFAKKALETKLETWQQSLDGLCTRASTLFYNILSYQDGGFLKDPCEEEAPDKNDQLSLNGKSRRTEELRALRRICLPEVVSLLHTVLHGTGRYAEAVDIANLVANEALCLYQEFSRDDIAALLVKIQESSAKLLKTPDRVDPYGIVDLYSF